MSSALSKPTYNAAARNLPSSRARGIQSADGYLYVATERSGQERSGIIYRIEPAQ